MPKMSFCLFFCPSVQLESRHSSCVSSGLSPSVSRFWKSWPVDLIIWVLGFGVGIKKVGCYQYLPLEGTVDP